MDSESFMLHIRSKERLGRAHLHFKPSAHHRSKNIIVLWGKLCKRKAHTDFPPRLKPSSILENCPLKQLPKSINSNSLSKL